MTKLAHRLATGVLTAFLATSAHASLLFESGINIDGTFLTNSFALPGVNATGFDAVTGLGSIEVEISGVGSHFTNLYLDHGIRETDNTIFNEFGGASGVAPTGVTWMVDDPFADIFFDTMDNTLQNTSYLPDAASAFDASMAIGIGFDLIANQIARAVFTVSTAMPTGFFVFQTDNDPLRGDETLYLSASLSIDDTANPVPEPSTTGLMLLGLLGALGLRSRRPS